MTKSAYKLNIIVFLILSVSFIILQISGHNQMLFVQTNKLASYIYPIFWENLTFLGDTLTVFAIMILFIRKRPYLVWSGIFAAILATLITNLLKIYLDVPRPPAILSKDMINIIGPALFQHSFPSGHTVTAFTFAGIIIFSFRNFIARIGLIVLALLIGISRIAVGVHWPADVLAGASLGIFCALFGVYLVGKLKWGPNKIALLIVGSFLILSTIYLMMFYDCKYDHAVYLKYSLSFILLIAGTRELFFIVKDK